MKGVAVKEEVRNAEEGGQAADVVTLLGGKLWLAKSARLAAKVARRGCLASWSAGPALGLFCEDFPSLISESWP